MGQSEDINELFDRVRKHPDYAGGTIWTREDVADALFEPPGGWGEERPTAADIARVTPEMAKGGRCRHLRVHLRAELRDVFLARCIPRLFRCRLSGELREK